MALNEWSFADQLHWLRQFLSNSYFAAQDASCMDCIRASVQQSDWRKQAIGRQMTAHGNWLIAGALAQIVACNGPEGWQTMRRGLHWQFWGQWIDIETNCRYAPARRGRSWPLSATSIEEIGFVFLHAYAVREDELAAQTGEWLTWFLDDKGSRVWEWSWPVHSFFLEVYRRWTKRPIETPRTLPQLGPYGAAFAHWYDQARFGNALVAICDYHCERVMAELDDTVDEPHYLDYPERVIPLELLALRRQRQDEGLPFPDVSHPLVDTPWFRSFPETACPFSDPHLDEIQSYFPDLLKNAARSPVPN
jgi:hypothetical protein